MEELILTMMATLDNFSEVDLNFTKQDIDKLAKKHLNLDNLQCNELGCIILFENGYITQDKFSKIMDTHYEDGHYILEIYSFDEILADEYRTEIEILDGSIDWNPGDYSYDADVKGNWYMYSEETLKSIVDFCDKKGLEYKEELITKDNTKIIDGKLYFNDEELEDIIDDDGLENLKDILNYSIIEAQEYADRNETENQVIDNFENDIGTYERKYIKINDKGIEKIYIKLNIDISEIKKELEDWYGEYDFETENYGSLSEILSEMDYFNFSTPDYNYIYGSIEKSFFNEITQNRLEWD